MRKRFFWVVLLSVSLFFTALLIVDLKAQSASDQPPDQQRRGRGAPRTPQPGTVQDVQWSEDGNFLHYATEGQRYSFNLVTREKKKIEAAKEEAIEETRRPERPVRREDTGTGQYVGRPSRGRQYAQVISPNEKWQAEYKNWNVVLKNLKTEQEIPVTADGDEIIHYGTASWVYGEELGQNKAMWWTPDSQKLLFYKFNDTGVKSFHLVRGWSDVITTHYPEYYPKAGDPNPVAGLMVYDLASQKTVTVDVGDDPEQYVYNIRVSPDGKVMMFNWTNRFQNHLKVMVIDLETGKTRCIVEEKQKTWQTNSPRQQYLADNHRFLWPTEKSGYTHYELRDLDGKLHNAVTHGQFQTGTIQFVDEENGLVGFTGYSSSVNPYYLQYHLVNLDGTNQTRVTAKDLHHSNFNLSPDHNWLVAQYEEVNTPPCTALYSTKGEFVTNLAETIKFKSADGKFDVYAILYKPANFNPDKKYP
ncbi:MAG: hypothetical protein AMJ79_15785, partial [Phycisphaerae bacterium SM23_30]